MLSKRHYSLDLWMPQNCPSHQALGKALPFTIPWRPSDFIMSHAFVKVLLCNVSLVYVSQSETKSHKCSNYLKFVIITLGCGLTQLN